MSNIASYSQCSLKTFLNCMMKILAGSWRKSRWSVLFSLYLTKTRKTDTHTPLLFSALMDLCLFLINRLIWSTTQQGGTMVSSGPAGSVVCLYLFGTWVEPFVGDSYFMLSSKRWTLEHTLWLSWTPLFAGVIGSFGY